MTPAPTPDGDTAEAPTISELGVMQPYLQNLKDVVGKLLAEQPAGTPMCYSLVDGNNVIRERDDGKYALRSSLILEADTCLPPDTRSQVIVVWPQRKWNKLGTTDAKMTPQELARLFDPLRQGTSVYFALVDSPKPSLKNEYTWLPNGKKKAQMWCRLPGMREADHLACELDDAILTALHCEFTLNNRCALVVSGDRRVIKTRKEMADLGGWVKAALEDDDSKFHVKTTFKKVTVGLPAPNAAALLRMNPLADEDEEQ